ncbi:hypothetical protein [Actinacidiphila sp. ITFR-21]|uniref:hypothetical protein n=1 Tax=Actinacidiphila sp. ITFR-21 TaxID=3075199 RepID=UPI00288AD29C|nr:hypothetical protein [Streptomyces sp. ITFR-21]WNI17366.1 hypothetical protein RLT57_18795 [Streptomyces sp. ITFR-21]
MAHHIMSSGRMHIVLRAPEGDQRDDPFAPPPEGAPDRPWQPRGPEGAGPGTGGQGHNGGQGQGGGNGGGQGQGGHDGHGGPGDHSGPGGHGPDGHSGHDHSPGPWAHGGPPDRGTPPPSGWGSQWSSRQPQSGRPDPFARRPEGGPTGPQGTGPKFDPTDPAHRRSRYALMSGCWGLIFGAVGWTTLALLLGALALYWGVSALRMSPEERAKARAATASALAEASQTPRPAPPAPGPDAQRSFLTAAWTGIVTSALALAIVAATYAFQLAYRDYYTCRSDALTSPAAHACQKLLPEPFRDLPTFRD